MNEILFYSGAVMTIVSLVCFFVAERIKNQ